jgi:hypothetical protein
MPFDVLSTTWADRAFRGGQEVRTWKLLRPIGCFAEDDGAGWTLEGESFQGDPSREQTKRRRFHAVHRCAGGWVLDSRGPEAEAMATGSARSAPFLVSSATSLELWIGGEGEGAGVRLLRGDEILETWTSRDRFGISPERHDLSAWAGEDLSIEVFDDSGTAGGYVVVGDVCLIARGVLDER